jgi:hypothetical protein
VLFAPAGGAAARPNAAPVWDAPLPDARLARAPEPPPRPSGRAAALQPGPWAGPSGHSAGPSRRVALDAALLGALRPQELPGLDLLAACRLRTPAARLLPARLGVRLRQAEEPGEQARTATEAAKSGGREAPASVLCLGPSGRVCVVRLPEGQGKAGGGGVVQQLALLQRAVAELPAHEAALLTGVEWYGMSHADSWALVVPEETAAGAGLAGGGSAFVAPGGRARGEEEEAEEEAAARERAAGCVDGGLLASVLAAAEAVVAATSSGGVALHGVLQRLSVRALGPSADVAQLRAVLLQCLR